MIIMAGRVVYCDGRNIVWAVEMLLVITMTVQDDVSSKEFLPVVHQKNGAGGSSPGKAEMPS